MRSIHRHRVTSWACVSLLVSALVFAAAAMAGEGENKRAQLNEGVVGYNEYRQYCAVCHGVFADGDGLVAPILKVAPTNLRTLGERHGSPLPRPKLREYIDGRRPVLAHGSREMPIWGRRLGEGYPNRSPEMSKRNIINAILNYLESVQQKSSG